MLICDAGIVVDEIVYDCTEFVGKHPGGSHIIKEFGGHDCSWQVCSLEISPSPKLIQPFYHSGGRSIANPFTINTCQQCG